MEGGKIKEDKKGFNQVERSEGTGEVVDEGPGLMEEKRLTRGWGGGGEESYKTQGRGERRN